MMAAMANPQKEDGYTPIANAILEAIAATDLSGGQTRLVLVLLRNSYGYNRKHATMSASDFARATGLHPKVVSREQREMEERGLIVVLRQEGRTSTYQFQKDYTRWQTGNQKVPATGNREVPSPEPKSSQTRNQKVPGLYKEVKNNSKDTTEPHGSGTLRDRTLTEYKRVRDGGGNTVAVFGELFSNVLGTQPNWALLGRLAKELNNGGKLIDLIIEAGRHSISDDPTAYLAKMVRNHKAGGTSRQGQAERNSGKTREMVL